LDDLALKDTARFMDLYREADPRVKDFYMVKADYVSIQTAIRTSAGKMFTDYTVQGGNPDGSDVKLSDYVGKGKYILLDHWASWCGPCKAEMPYLKKTYEAFHGDRFDIVGVAVSDKREDTEKAIPAWDLPWNQILDAQRIPLELYGVNAIPHLILFAPDGKILARGLRGEDIYAAVEAALKQ
jgi:thiol-disulfide isomerase/thioredoxin